MMMNLGFLTIFWRDMIRFYRFKTLLISSLVQPALWMAFFGIAMSSNFNRLTTQIPPIPGVPVVDYLTYMAAGVIAMTTLFTSLFGGIVILFDKNWGLMREIFASPLPRDHIIFGIAFSGYTVMQTILSIAGILLFVGIFSLGFLFLSAAISVSLESPEGLQGIITLLTMPIFFASNALYPVTAFPPVLQAISLINPLTYLVTGIRYFAIGNNFQAIGIHYTATPASIVLAFFFLVLFAVLMFALAWWRFRKASVT
jgi:ABC-2 type transport system permease protein